MNEAVEETGHAAAEVLTASDELGRQADRLRVNVNGFLDNIRAA